MFPRIYSNQPVQLPQRLIAIREKHNRQPVIGSLGSYLEKINESIAAVSYQPVIPFNKRVANDTCATEHSSTNLLQIIENLTDFLHGSKFQYAFHLKGNTTAYPPLGDINHSAISVLEPASSKDITPAQFLQRSTPFHRLGLLSENSPENLYETFESNSKIYPIKQTTRPKRYVHNELGLTTDLLGDTFLFGLSSIVVNKDNPVEKGYALVQFGSEKDLKIEGYFTNGSTHGKDSEPFEEEVNIDENPPEFIEELLTFFLSSFGLESHTEYNFETQ